MMAHTQDDVEQASATIRKHGQWGYRGHTIIVHKDSTYQVVPYMERFRAVALALAAVDMMIDGYNARLTMRPWTMRR